MIFKRYEWRILSRILLLFGAITGTAVLIVQQQYVYLILVIPFIIYLLADMFRFQKKAHDELNQFVESVHYRDFSRYFDVKKAPEEIRPLREGFNEINTTFKVISKEKETQYHYLQKILELVDTGILSYRMDDGEVVWMNESLKQLLALPYLKTIESLGRRNETLAAAVTALQPGTQEVFTLQRDKESVKVLLTSSVFQTDNQLFKLVAFQNVSEALDETESRAWQRLLSVMTHEIMNSIAPISSLAATLKTRLQESANHPEKEADTLDDLEIGIDTIKKRSEGLLKFAQTYRNLNKITTPNLKRVHVADLFENIYQLMQPTLEQKEIELETILKDPLLQLDVDSSLIEQVLINLVVNAIDAVKDQPEPNIFLSAYVASNKRTIIKVSDNGPGMEEDLLDKIFIPFFSTKKSGSGIGLSLCKQIMLLHKGNIQVQSVPGEGTAFTLQF